MLQQFSVRHLTFQIKSCPFIVLIFFFHIKIFLCVVTNMGQKNIWPRFNSLFRLFVEQNFFLGWCKFCKMQYVGQTKNKFSTQCNNHCSFWNKFNVKDNND